MVDFFLLTNEQALVDQLDSFELSFDLCESIEGISSLQNGTILALDLTNEEINIDSVQSVIGEGVFVVAIVHALPKKTIKKLLDTYPFIYAHLTTPLIKSDFEALLEDLKSYISHKGSDGNSGTNVSQKFDLEFSLFENETSPPEIDEDQKEQLPTIDQEQLNKISKKLGNFNFFEDKEFAMKSEENIRIQQKFNLVFIEEKKTDTKNQDSLDLNNYESDNDNFQDEAMSSKNKGLDFNMPKLEFDEVKETKKEDSQHKTSLDFDLEFGDSEVSSDDNQDEELQKVLAASKKAQEESPNHDSIGLNFEDDAGLEIENQSSNSDATSKTIVFDRNSLKSETGAEKPNDVGNDGKESLSFSDLESELADPEESAIDFSEPEGGVELSGLDQNDDFSLDLGEDSASSVDVTKSEGALELGLGADDIEIEIAGTKSKNSAPAVEKEADTDSLGLDLGDEGFSLDSNEEIDFGKVQEPSSSLASLGSSNTNDYMSSAEARVNIENTIKDIIRPDLNQSEQDKTGELDLSELQDLEDVNEKTLVADPKMFVNKSGETLDDVEFDPEFSFGKTDPSNSGFKGVDEISFETGIRAKNVETAIQETRSGYKVPSELDKKENNHLVFKNLERDEEVRSPMASKKRSLDTEEIIQNERRVIARHNEYSEGNFQDEDFIRAQATIRQLREELEEQLIELKQLRRENKELEQENLSLRAQCDELKIEQNILRKRQLAENEDLKYQLQLAEEKRLTAEERLKHSEKQKEKLEQKLRLDFSQVRQREKELENQLELLSIDHDAQIQTRDSKILELRRKIESLEFNMENASIREQKTNEDKKKLEDKLIKIMKTLRHSIENIDEENRQVSFSSNDLNNDED